jgi:hypothetical protein
LGKCRHGRRPNPGAIRRGRLEDQPKTNPEKKITATTNTTPAIMPIHAKV